MVQTSYLSVPSPGKWISDLFGKQIFDHCLTIFWTNMFSKNGPQKGPQRGSHKLKKFVYWSSSYEVFTEIRVFDRKFPSKFQFFGKTLFSVFTIQKISSKENSDFWISFWALFLLCCRWFFFSQKKTISGKRRLAKRVMFRSFLTIFVQVSQCHFFCPRQLVN